MSRDRSVAASVGAGHTALQYRAGRSARHVWRAHDETVLRRSITVPNGARVVRRLVAGWLMRDELT